jgi:dolichol-phosphate mannosyltransferase
MIPNALDSEEGWQVPVAEITEFKPRRTKYCVCIVVINEGQRILGQLERMQTAGVADLADILIVDGGSSDGSMVPEKLRTLGIRALLIKLGPGRQGAQSRIGWSYALRQGYEGVITVDGNGKDGIEAIPRFCAELDAGFDFVQGSRYIAGGAAVRTPLSRAMAIKLLHAPAIRFASGFRYTDTTNAFRAHSRRLLLDPRVQPFRDIFSNYELLAYMSVRAAQLGFRIREIPVRREYPGGKVPTKISHFRGNLMLITTLWRAATGRFDPE